MVYLFGQGRRLLRRQDEHIHRGVLPGADTNPIGSSKCSKKKGEGACLRENLGLPEGIVPSKSKGEGERGGLR